MPKFQYRHYVSLASMVNRTRLCYVLQQPQVDHVIGLAALEQLVEVMAQEFKMDNPHFDRIKFMEACGLA